jgi:hypothetical protein
VPHGVREQTPGEEVGHSLLQLVTSKPQEGGGAETMPQETFDCTAPVLASQPEEEFDLRWGP